MTFIQLLNILRARSKIILLTFFTVVLATAAYSLLTPKEYTASTKVLFNTKATDPVTGISLLGQMTDSYLLTQLEILKSDAVALEVIKRLGLDKNEAVIERFNKATQGEGDIHVWLANLIVSKLNVIANGKSNIVEITYSAEDPKFASVMANTFTDVYLEKNIALKTEPAQKAANYLNQQVQVLRDDLAKAQVKLSSYQKESGLTSVDERMDVESSRLGEISAQLSEAQSQLVDANSRYHDVQKDLSNSPDVSQNSLVQNLKIELYKAQSSFASISQTLSKNHPEYIALVSQIEKINRQLNEEMARVAGSVSSSVAIAKERTARLKQQVEEQKLKVLALNQTRGEMMNLENDVISARAALENANKLFGLNSLEGESGQGNVVLLDTATPPFDASKPNIIRNTFFSVLGGIFLGLFFGLTSEFLNRKVRDRQDLIDLVDAPVYVISNSKKSNNLLTKYSRTNKLLPSS